MNFTESAATDCIYIDAMQIIHASTVPTLSRFTMQTQKIYVFSVALVFLSITLASGIPVSARQEVDDEPQASFEPVDIFPDRPKTMLGTSFMINAGGDAVGSYSRDDYLLVTGTTGSFHAPPETVVNAGDTPAKVYLSHRYGLGGTPFSYSLPLAQAGTYECTLHFAETFIEYQIVGGRVFSVSATGSAGSETASNIDVFAESAEDPTKPVYRTFTITATDTIKFDFEAHVAEAMVSAIACNVV